MTPKRPMALPKISTMRIFTKRLKPCASAKAAPLPTMPTHSTEEVRQAHCEASPKHGVTWRDGKGALISNQTQGKMKARIQHGLNGTNHHPNSAKQAKEIKMKSLLGMR